MSHHWGRWRQHDRSYRAAHDIMLSTRQVRHRPHGPGLPGRAHARRRRQGRVGGHRARRRRGRHRGRGCGGPTLHAIRCGCGGHRRFGCAPNPPCNKRLRLSGRGTLTAQAEVSSHAASVALLEIRPPQSTPATRPRGPRLCLASFYLLLLWSAARRAVCM
jgi:hypothetical protein